MPVVFFLINLLWTVSIISMIFSFGGAKTYVGCPIMDLTWGEMAGPFNRRVFLGRNRQPFILENPIISVTKPLE